MSFFLHFYISLQTKLQCRAQVVFTERNMTPHPEHLHFVQTFAFTWHHRLSVFCLFCAPLAPIPALQGDAEVTVDIYIYTVDIRDVYGTHTHLKDY